MSACSAKIRAASSSPAACSSLARRTFVSARTSRRAAAPGSGGTRTIRCDHPRTQRSTDPLELVVIPQQPDPRPAEEVAEEPSSRRVGLPKLLECPDHGFDVSTEIGSELCGDQAEASPVDSADQKQIDIAVALIPPGCIRAEEERELKALHGPKCRTQARGDSGGLSDQIPHGGNQGAVLSHGPQAEISQRSALDHARGDEMRERPMDRMRIGADTTGDLTRV